MPLVSILMPVYNAAATLPAALRSISAQSFREWELILIDDGSTDGCMAGFSSSDSRIRVVQDKRNLGLAARLNQGIDLARGRYLARMDHDDIAYPGRLVAQVRFLEEHPDVNLVATRALIFRDDGSVVGLFPFRRTHAEICATPWRGFYFPHPTWMGRIEWFRQHRYRIPEIARAEDQDLLLRSYSTSRFACLPEVQMGYRQTLLSLKTVLTARRNLALAQWSVNLQQGRPIHAVLGLLAFAIKALADATIGMAGARHLFITRMARDAPQEEIDRWRKIWQEMRQTPEGYPPSPRTTRAAP